MQSNNVPKKKPQMEFFLQQTDSDIFSEGYSNTWNANGLYVSGSSLNGYEKLDMDLCLVFKHEDVMVY